ncbi:hypothetical protein MASR2M18_14710 [Ignavibacteria bacterium]|nr:hypothetical protein [Bacteroidota bacterium]MCZ2133013.1 hypothetical protein [Bacteroidota bacterium]
MQRIESFEGERYFFDVILQSNKGKTTFEIRSTCADTGASSVVTSVKELAESILENTSNRNETRYKSPVWEISEVEGKELFDHATGLFANQDFLEKMEDAMNDDRASGSWSDEDDFAEEYGFDDGDDENGDFDDDEFDGDFNEEDFR